MKALATLLLLASGVARADEDVGPKVSARASVGVEALTGEATGETGFRGQFALDYLVSSSCDRCYHAKETRVGLGLTTGIGEFYNYAERKSGTRHQYGYKSVGPQVVLTRDRLGDNGGTKVFGTVALVDTMYAYQFKSRTDGLGERVTIGVNFARDAYHSMGKGLDEAHGRDESINATYSLLFEVLMPVQYELALEHDPGSTRFGIVASWGY